MKRYNIVLGLAAMSFAMACGGIASFSPTATPYPTYTPLPTYTPPPPTATPDAGDWEVDVISAESSLEFEDFFIPEDGTNTLIIVVVKYAYEGPGRIQFSPESVVLTYTGSEKFMGWSQTADLYQSEGDSQVVDFSEQALLNTLNPGDAKTDTFVWEFPRSYKNFILLFPSAEPIEVTIK